MYLKLQKYYDQLGFGNFAGFFFKEALPVIEEYLRTGNMDKGNLRIIDLACGTGILCRLFGNRGYSICGLDMSRAMLIQARRRNPRMRFYKKDLRKFSLKAKFHVATCSFDSLNHLLTYEELRAAFKNIAGCLEKTGVFIFDMNTPSGLLNWRHILVNSKPDHFIVRNGDYDESRRLAKVIIEAFVKKENGDYDRIREVFYQKGYSNSAVRRCLKEAGFTAIKIRDFFKSKPISQAQRVLVVACK